MRGCLCPMTTNRTASKAQELLRGATREQLREAVGWLVDVEYPAALSMGRGSVVTAVDRNYEGGWAQFQADCEGVQVR
jgi:hypothetical protein